MNPSLFFSTLRARFSLFVLALGTTVAAATAVSLMLPKSYRATASLVVDTREEQSLSNTLNAFAARERTGYLHTQVDIITSPKVARKVVDSLELADRPAVRKSFKESTSGRGSIEDWLVESLLSGVEVETSQSSIIDVSYPSEDPEDAAMIANGFAQAYMDTVLELRVEPTRQAAAWFDEQLKTLRADLEAAQAKMTEYQQQHGIVSVDERLDEEYTRLSELSAQLLRAEAEAVELQAREEQAHRALELGVSLDRLPEIQSNSYIQQLNAELLEGEARLRVLATQYGANHPEYRRQLAENKSRHEKLDGEMKKILEATENLRRQSEQRGADIEAALAAQRDRVLALKESRDDLTVLMRNIDTAQSAHDTAMQRFVVSQVESRASQANVALLNPAIVPREPYRPDFKVNLALAIVVGTMLGTALVMFMEMSDRRLRSAADLSRGSSLPVLGELSVWTPTKGLLLTGPKGHGSTIPSGG